MTLIRRGSRLASAKSCSTPCAISLAREAISLLAPARRRPRPPRRRVRPGRMTRAVFTWRSMCLASLANRSAEQLRYRYSWLVSWLVMTYGHLWGRSSRSDSSSRLGSWDPRRRRLGVRARPSPTAPARRGGPCQRSSPTHSSVVARPQACRPQACRAACRRWPDPAPPASARERAPPPPHERSVGVWSPAQESLSAELSERRLNRRETASGGCRSVRPASYTVVMSKP